MSTVIKASGPIRAVDSGSFNFNDMTDRANGYLDTVRLQAAEILAKAQQDAVAIRQRAEDEGRSAALEAAKKILEEKVSKQVTTLVPALRGAVEQIHTSQAEWLLHWERAAIRVSAAIAERVIRREVAQAPDITLALVKEALELAAGKADIQVRMHPDDVEALGAQVEKLAVEVGRLGSAQIVPDAEIAKGGCRVDTRFGSIDQQFAAQLARIEEELT